MQVKDLVEFLLTQPQDIQVAYSLYSEQCLLDLTHIEMIKACKPRKDGWIHHARPDKPLETYLLFTGN
jgi:hypothetical protein